MPFYKKKKFYVIVGIAVLVVGGIAYGKIKQANQQVQYDTVAVERGDLTQTVDATGKIKSLSDLSLRFEGGGTLAAVKVKEGDEVKEGDILANLNLASLDAAVAQARANLNQKLAGVTEEELAALKALADNAESSWKKAKVDADSSVVAAKATLDTAKADLELTNGGGQDSQIIIDAYKDAIVLLHKTSSVLDDALIQADNILGIDNKSANDDFEDYLSILDSGKLLTANDLYLPAKEKVKEANELILPLTTLNFSQHEVDDVLDKTEQTLTAVGQLLYYVLETLNATPPFGDLTAAALDTKKTTITTARASVNTQYTSTVNQIQAIETARDDYDEYQIAYDKALEDYDAAQANAVNSVNLYKALYDQALANYQNKLNPPRAVDIAYYQAALSQALANRDKAILKAPMDGRVTKVNKKKGEFVSATDIMIEMESPHYEIEVDIPETDVSKLEIGNEVEYTLDAFGDEVKFAGKVASIDPASTEIQDVVYYKVNIPVVGEYMEETDEKKMIKPGMTANVSINADQAGELKNVLYIPLRAVRINEQGHYVEVLENGSVQNKNLILGQRADEGLVAVVSGLSEGEQVILGIKQ